MKKLAVVLIAGTIGCRGVQQADDAAGTARLRQRVAALEKQHAEDSRAIADAVAALKAESTRLSIAEAQVRAFDLTRQQVASAPPAPVATSRPATPAVKPYAPLPMPETNNFGTFPSSSYGSSTPVTTDSTIIEFCKKEWGTDYRMIAFCQQKQQDAKISLETRERQHVVNDVVLSGIQRGCAQEWGSDYRMRDYCEKKQVDAYKATGGR